MGSHGAKKEARYYLVAKERQRGIATIFTVALLQTVPSDKQQCMHDGAIPVNCSNQHN